MESAGACENSGAGCFAALPVSASLPGMSAEVLVPLMVFSMPVMLVFVTKYFRYKEKLLDMQSGASGKLLTSGTTPDAERRIAELTARVENLESIVISMDGDAERQLTGRRTAAAALPTAANTKALPGQKAALLAARAQASDVDGVDTEE